MRIAILAVLAVALALGCNPPEPLDHRVKAYWKARQERDFKVAYELEDPSLRGEQADYTGRMSGGPLAIRGAELVEVRTEQDKSFVKVKVSYRHPMMPKDVETTFDDLWVRVDGHWFHQQPEVRMNARALSTGPESKMEKGAKHD